MPIIDWRNTARLLGIAHSEGYRCVRVLPTGEIAGLLPFIFTTGLCTGIDEFGYRRRWCYQTAAEAARAISMWDGVGEPCGFWVKAKGRGPDGLNARVFRGIRLVVERHE